MKLRFVSKKQEFGDTWSFFFEPMESMEWQAGQSIRLELPRQSWGYDERRFTIASAPYEKHLQITTRLSGSEFKNLLDALKPNDEIDGHNIEGDFVWDSAVGKTLFLAAGIGITPFRAMLASRDAGDTVLLYGTRDEQPVFYDELKTWLGDNLHVLNGRIDENYVKQTVPDWQDRLVYISGPERMVFELKKQLIEAGLAEKNIKTDLFTLNEQY